MERMPVGDPSARVSVPSLREAGLAGSATCGGEGRRTYDSQARPRHVGEGGAAGDEEGARPERATAAIGDRAGPQLL